MKASASLKSKIKAEEGFSAKAYKDDYSGTVAIEYSIGYGHQIQPNESYLKTSTLTRAQADAMFDKDLVYYENAVNKATRSLNQNQFDALVMFAYNAGVGSVANVLKTWNATGDSIATTERMKLYNKSTQNGVLKTNSNLVARRLKEASLFLSAKLDTIVAEAKKKSGDCIDCPNCGCSLNLVSA